MFKFSPNDPNHSSQQSQGQAKQEGEVKAKKTEKEIAEQNRRILAKAIGPKTAKPSHASKFAKKITNPPNTSEIPQMSQAVPSMNPQSLPSKQPQYPPKVSQNQPRRPSFFGDSIQQQMKAKQQIFGSKAVPDVSVHRKSDASAQQSQFIANVENPFLTPEQVQQQNLQMQQQRRDSNSASQSKERALAMYIQQMQAHQKQHEAANTRIEESKEAIEKLSQQLEECLVNENYTEADKLSKKISSIKVAVSQYEKSLSQSLNNALALAKDAPNQLTTHNDDLKNQIPALQERRKQYDQLLIKLVEQQQIDKLEKDQCKKDTDEKVALLSEPLRLRQTEFEARRAAYDDKVKEAEKPFTDKIEELKQEKMEHENEIKALLAEVEKHRKAVKEITVQIQQEEKNGKKAVDEYKAEFLLLNKEIKQFETESQAAKKEIKEAEDKYEKLVQLVDQREKDIVSTTEKLDSITNQLADAEKDQMIIEVTTKRINDLCQAHDAYLENRKAAEELDEEANQKLIEFEASSQNLSAEQRSLEAKIQECKNTIDSAIVQIPQLEIQKQGAVAAKNFKDAGQFSNQIKALEAAKNQAEIDLQKSEERIKEVKSELENIGPNREKFETEASQAHRALIDVDLTFYNEIEKDLSLICEESPFCLNVLGPLSKMVSLEVKILSKSSDN